MRINLTKLARYGVPQQEHPAAFGAIAGFLRRFAPSLFATYNYKGGYVGGSNTGPVSVPGGFNVANIKLDFAAIAAARVAAGAAALGAADILEIFGVKAGIWVPAVFGQTTKVEGAAATYQLGDGTDPNGFTDTGTGNLNALGWNSSLVTTAYSLATAGGKLYTADDTIDMTLDSAAIDVAVIQLFVVMVDVRAYRQ